MTPAERAEQYIPGGTQTLSKGADRFVRGVSPRFIAYGNGAHVVDDRGQTYIDWPMALGAIILGYNVDLVTEAISVAAEAGPVFTLPSMLEGELAELLVEKCIPSAEMVRFCKNGGDATEGAIRIARAVTGKQHIANYGYHGCHDWSAVTGGLRRGLIDHGLVHDFAYNDLRSLGEVLEQYSCAAVIMEIPPEEIPPYGVNFVTDCCKLAHLHGALFILDEIVTGFRYSIGGAAPLYGVDPDLVCIGKAMANGLPISAICGKRDYMKTLEDGVFFSFTFGGETTALAAAIATIEIIQGRRVVDDIWDKGRLLRGWLQEAADNVRLKINLRGNRPRSVLEIPGPDGKPDLMAYSLFLQETHRRGVLFGVPIFPCWSHTREDLTRTVDAAFEAFKLIVAAEGDYRRFLDGEPIAKPVIRT